MRGLATVIHELENADVRGQLWIDGSFLTEKHEPEDVDFVLRTHADIYDFGTDSQRRVIDWIIENRKHDLLCDSYWFPVFDDGDPQHAVGEWWHAYWLKQFGFSRAEQMKGIAVYELDGASRVANSMRLFWWHVQQLNGTHPLRILPSLRKM